MQIIDPSVTLGFKFRNSNYSPEQGGFKFMEPINTFLTVQFTQVSIVWGNISPYVVFYTKVGIEMLIGNGGALVNECVCYVLASSVSIVTDKVLDDQ
jgi:hypothetical protein